MRNQEQAPAPVSSSALAETRLIVEALRVNHTAEGWLAECAQAQVNWDNLAVRAIVLGLATQLHHRLTEWRVSALPPRTAAKLAVTYQMQAERSDAIFAQLGEVLAACAGRGLRPIALKGVHLAGLIYPEPALRPMNDIDLLFTPEELPAAEALLASLGYGARHKSAQVGPGVVKHTSTFKREADAQSLTPNPYLSTESERMIEPHTSLEESWFGLKVDITPGVCERALPTRLASQPCRVLANEDLLLHLCVHFCFHLIQGAPAMVQLADLKAVTALPIDWRLFTDRACARRAAPYALAALTLAQKLLDAPVASALPALAPATPTHLRRRIDQLGLSDILQRTQQKPLRTLGERVRRGFSDRAETARWALDWRDRWRVWQTALRVENTDTGRLLFDSFVANFRKKQA
jgi:hypothetical protein